MAAGSGEASPCSHSVHRHEISACGTDGFHGANAGQIDLSPKIRAKRILKHSHNPLIFLGAWDESRTRTLRGARDFKSLASTCSATQANGQHYLLPKHTLVYKEKQTIRRNSPAAWAPDVSAAPGLVRATGPHFPPDRPCRDRRHHRRHNPLSSAGRIDSGKSLC